MSCRDRIASAAGSGEPLTLGCYRFSCEEVMRASEWLNELSVETVSRLEKKGDVHVMFFAAAMTENVQMAPRKLRYLQSLLKKSDKIHQQQ